MRWSRITDVGGRSHEETLSFPGVLPRLCHFEGSCPLPSISPNANRTVGVPVGCWEDKNGRHIRRGAGG